MSIRLLIIDDQPNDLRYIQAAINQAGFEYRICTTYADAIEEFDANHFDLVLLDINFDASPLIGLSDADDGNELHGLSIYANLRTASRSYTPIVLFTAYAGEGWMQEWLREATTHDNKLTILNKNTLPRDLIAYIQNLVRIDGPYFAVDARLDTTIEMLWQPVSIDDIDVINDQWRNRDNGFLDVFLHYIQSSSAISYTYKLYTANDQDRRVHALLYIGGHNNQWCTNVLFEVAPWNQYGIPEREFRRIGTICIARLIRESQRRNMRGELALMINIKSREFFEWIGFKRFAQSRFVYYLDQEDAMRILSSITSHDGATE